MLTISLPDGSKKQFDAAVTPHQIAESISPRLAKAGIAARVGGELWDYERPISEDAEVSILTDITPEALEILRHTGAHIMAQAVTRLWPDAKFTIGPVIKDGFYYDFDMPVQFSPEDFEKIEAEMGKIAQENHAISRFELKSPEAVSYFKEKGNKYKVELIEGFGVPSVSFYKQGEYTDLCEGPHLPSTGHFKAFKLLSVAGSYWRGDEKRDRLQRIYATAFFNKKDLDSHLQKIEDAKQRDHRKLGKELGLFSFMEEGPGFPFWLPNGQTLFTTLESYIREQNYRRGYQEIKTPIVLSEHLWKKSGHYDHFREHMYFTKAGEDFNLAVKPMNCPGACLVFGREIRSYRDLPLKFAELGHVHRMELGGVMHGLLRVRAFTQDDAHLYVSPEILEREITAVIDYAKDIYATFGFKKVKTFIATRPENSMGTDDQWKLATDSLANALTAEGMTYEFKEGEGAFYGPKIEFNIEDALERNWQLGTIQVDFSMPSRFELTYEGSDGHRHTPVMIHKAILGSLERFIGILIEHFGGKFPTWLSPVHAEILPVSEKHHAFAESIRQKLVEAGLRAHMDARNEKLGYKIRAAQLSKVPYMLIVGDKEAESNSVNVRTRDNGEFGAVEIPRFIDAVCNEIKDRTLEVATWK